MTELMKKYIELADEKKKDNDLYWQLLDQRHQKVLLIKANEDVFGEGLRQELVNTIFEFYDNDEKFKELKNRRKKASHEMDILWQIATDDEKNKINQYFDK